MSKYTLSKKLALTMFLIVTLATSAIADTYNPTLWGKPDDETALGYEDLGVQEVAGQVWHKFKASKDAYVATDVLLRWTDEYITMHQVSDVANNKISADQTYFAAKLSVVSNQDNHVKYLADLDELHRPEGWSMMGSKYQAGDHYRIVYIAGPTFVVPEHMVVVYENPTGAQKPRYKAGETVNALAAYSDLGWITIISTAETGNSDSDTNDPEDSNSNDDTKDTEETTDSTPPSEPAEEGTQPQEVESTSNSGGGSGGCNAGFGFCAFALLTPFVRKK